jgi:uncharacterized protein YoxC
MSLKAIFSTGTNPHAKLSAASPSAVAEQIKNDIEKSFNTLISKNKPFTEFENTTKHFERIINDFCNNIQNSKEKESVRTSLTQSLNENQKNYLKYFLGKLVTQSQTTIGKWTRTLSKAENLKDTIEEKKQQFNSNVAIYKDEILKFYQEFKLPEELKLLIDNTLYQEILELQNQIKSAQAVFERISPAQKQDEKCIEGNKVFAFFRAPFSTTDEKIKKLIETVQTNLQQMQQINQQTPQIKDPIKKIVDLSKNVQGFDTRLDLFFKDLKETSNRVQSLLKSSKYKDSILDDVNQVCQNYEQVKKQFNDIKNIGDLLDQAHPGMGYKKTFLEIEKDMQTEYLSLLDFSEVVISYQKLIRALGDQSTSSITKCDLQRVARAPFGLQPLMFHLRCGVAFIHQTQFLQYFENQKVLSYLTDLQRIFEILPGLKIKDFDDAIALRDSIFAFKSVKANLEHNLLSMVTSDQLQKISSPKVDISPLIELISKELTKRIEAHEANLQETSLKNYLAWLTPILANCPRFKTSALSKLIDQGLEALEKKPAPKIIFSTPVATILADLDEMTQTKEKPQPIVGTSTSIHPDEEEWTEIKLTDEPQKFSFWNFLMSFKIIRWIATRFSS